MKEFIKKNKINILVTAIYAVVTLTMIFFHEQWRDEAQQWLIVKDLNFFGVINQMKYEGHFLPWYLILMPFAKLGFPFVTINIISCLFMTVSVWLILTKAPFNNVTKYLIVFSSPFLYFYSVISRVYCLIPLAEILIAITYKERLNKPYRYILSLVFLANTHIVMMGQVGILIIEYILKLIIEKKKQNISIKKNVFALLISGCLIVISLLPIVNSLSVSTDVNNTIEFSKGKILEVVFANPFNHVLYCLNAIGIEYVIEYIFAVVVILYVYLMIRKPAIGIGIGICCIWQYLIYSFVFYNNTWRALTIIPEMIFFFWIVKNDTIKDEKYVITDKIIKWVCYVLLVININAGLIIAIMDISYKYSNSKDVARYIEENLDKSNSVIVTGDIPECLSPIIANYDEIPFYSVQLKEYFTYITYNNDLRREVTYEEVKKVIKELLTNGKDVYYLDTQSKLFDFDDEEIVKQLIDENVIEIVRKFNEPSIAKDEVYVLYKVNN